MARFDARAVLLFAAGRLYRWPYWRLLKTTIGEPRQDGDQGMGAGTPATRALSQANISFRVLEYDYVAGHDRIGLHAAEAIGWDPGRVLKTLMVEVDGKPACAVIPSDRTLSMKRVAAAFGGKAAQMMAPDKAERLTGFHTGGISPFGQKRRLPTVFEIMALVAAEVVINGGRRGLMLALAPDDALSAADASEHSLCAD